MFNPQPPRGRRVTASDLKKAKRALKKAIRKEIRRRDTLAKLRKENEELYVQLSRLRSADQEGY